VLIGTEPGPSVHWKYSLYLCVRTWNNVHADKLAHSSGRGCACVSCRLNRSDISPDKDRYVACSNIFFAQQLNVCGFDHRIRGFNSTHEPFGLNHSERF
jgi:hypothetical protein